jgi:hypothetical protein
MKIHTIWLAAFATSFLGGLLASPLRLIPAEAVLYIGLGIGMLALVLSAYIMLRRFDERQLRKQLNKP